MCVYSIQTTTSVLLILTTVITTVTTMKTVAVSTAAATLAMHWPLMATLAMVSEHLADLIEVFLIITFVADINECSSNNGGCAQNCHNTVGSYNCTCNTGYSLASNGHNCNGECWNETCLP